MFNPRVVLKSRPDETFPESIDCFFYQPDSPIPNIHDLLPDQILLRIVYISIEPVTRVWISGAKSYLDPIKPSEAIPSFGIAKVIYSKHKNYKENDVVFGMFAWESFHVASSQNIFKLPVDLSMGNITKFLSLFGPTGLTAYLGLKEEGKPQKDEVLVVSAAAGSCGSIVVQLGKRWGCKVIGIAGSDEKCEYVKSLGADDCINYKKANETNKLADILKQSIQKINGKGVDIFFDNVGENILDAVLINLNEKARIILCGAMATYGNWKNYLGIKNFQNIIFKRATVQGILYFGEVEKCKEALFNLWNMNEEKEIKTIEEVIVGIENAPKALQNVYYGLNKGKYIIALQNHPYNQSKL